MKQTKDVDKRRKFRYSCKICYMSDLLSPEECQDREFSLGAKIRWCTKYDNYCQRVAWNCKRVSSRYGN